MRLDHSAAVGVRGEQFAAKYLRDNGYEILSANFDVRGRAEIDIIAYISGVLCFVEVKTRSKAGFLRPADAVDEKKELNIASAARVYLKALRRADPDREVSSVRFDVCEVELSDMRTAAINYVKSAFSPVI